MKYLEFKHNMRFTINRFRLYNLWAQSHSKPITFKLKNKLYEQDLKEITKRVFEKCSDNRYALEYGDNYKNFLQKDLKVKMNDLEYEWFVEACEKEYQIYPIKFQLKYY